MIETGFGKEFSEPPNVAVSAERTHCEACKEPLDPNVMHKCHGNKHYEPPVVSYTHITEHCPECGGDGMVAKQEMFGLAKAITSYAIVCQKCRTYLWPLVDNLGDAIASWNTQALTGRKGCWPKWLADVPGADERSNGVWTAVTVKGSLTVTAKAAHPDLTNYQGACPAVHAEGEVCDWCENTGVIPPTKGDAS